MNKHVKWLIIVFVLLVLVKAILSLFILTPTQFADEYFYQRMAQSFFKGSSFLVDEQPSTYYPPLYPIIISLSFIFNNMVWIYSFMKLINCVLSSTIIFAGFLLAREFMSRKRALIVSILIALVPPMFGFFPFIMAENLFYPLFLFAIYFMYKSLIEKETRWPILTGIFIGLCGLTKILGLGLIPVYIITLLIKLIKEKNLINFIKNSLLSSLTFLIVYSWWMLRNFFVLGSFLGDYGNIETKTEVFIIPLLKNIFILSASYFSYLILSCLIIFFIYALKKPNEKKRWLYLTSWISVVFYILAALYHSCKMDYAEIGYTARMIERYFANIIPLVIILGYSNFRKNRINFKIWIPSLITLFIISGFRFLGERFVPVNNMSLSYIGVFDFGLNYLLSNNYLLILFLGLIPLSLLILKRLNLKKIAILGCMFFIVINLLNFGISAYNSNYRWYNQEPVQMGIWFNSLNIDKNSVVVFDERDDGQILREYDNKYSEFTKVIERPNEVMAFWINARVIRFYNTSDLEGVDYVISPYEMSLELIEHGEKIYVYKTIEMRDAKK